MMDRESESESSDETNEKDIVLSMGEKAGKVQEPTAYTKLKNDKGKTAQEESMREQYSLKRKATAADESDEYTSEQYFCEVNKLETELEGSFSESVSDEIESETPKHREKMKPKSVAHIEEMYHEKLRDKDEKIMSQKYKKPS